MEVDWIKPKTNWASTDKMNLEDYNRIKNNILYLKEKANEVNKEFSILLIIWSCGIMRNSICLRVI